MPRAPRTSDRPPFRPRWRARQGRWWLGVAALTAVCATSASAGENLETERQIEDLRVEERQPPDLGEPIAGLPIIAYSPEQGVTGGAKLIDRDLTPAHLTLDVLGLYAEKKQQEFDLTLAVPELGSERWLGLLEASYFLDPTTEFFGLGNAGRSSNELSTHEVQGVSVLLTAGYRLAPHWTVAGGAGLVHTEIRRGDLEEETPATSERFPDLAGISGGYTDPVSLSLIFDDRDDLTRPTHGDSVIAKIQHVDPLLGGSSRYTRFVLDGSMVRPFLDPRNVLAVHVSGEYIEGATRDIPFYELAPLGGATDLRGYLFDRFFGRGRLFANFELRRQLYQVQVRDWWLARLDGVAFADVGRVFFGASEVARALGETTSPQPSLVDDVRVSYGGGLRIALGDALVIRLDLGFSAEETALLFLDFGQTF